ncbi:MAG: hypothetical protein GY841_12560 [FCB group bacterium]|nr:hypothetical protein [FCB group bacterium]
MEQIKFKLTGETELLMHNNRMANPLDKYAQEMGKKSGKRKKTTEDIWELARIEWEGGLYFYDGEIKLPVRVVNKCMERGATKQKNGMLWKTGCFIEEDYCPVRYSGKTISVRMRDEVPNPELDKHFKKYLHQSIVKVGQASILRSRPIFKDWSLEFTALYDGSVINEQALVQAAKDAGRLVGMCDWRPEKGGQFGRFSVEVID